jgi:hypothetical protein
MKLKLFYKRKRIISIIGFFIGSILLLNSFFISIAETQSMISHVESTNLFNKQSDYWALLIAVAVYADDPEQNRPLMLQEVDDFETALLNSPWWQEDHIKTIKGEDATVRNIIDGFKWLDSKEDSDDISVVYITTHGFPLGEDIPPLDEADGTDEALVSYWGFAYKNLFIWDDELNFLLNQLESHGVCLIVDSCYAGGFNDPPDWSSDNLGVYDSAVEWMNGFAEDVSGQGRVVLMASCEDEVSYSGGFAPYLIDGIRGYGDANQDGIVTAEEAFLYAEPRTTRQNPTIYDNFPGELPIITSNIEIDNIAEIEKTSPNNKIIVDRSHLGSMISENSIICGYVTNSETYSPIENAFVNAVQGDYWEGYWNETLTDSTGYYSINVEPGDVRILAGAKGYFNFQTNSITIIENDIIWINISLDFHPQENSKICGYMTDIETDLPIEYVYVYFEWGSWRRGYWNDTLSDSNGYYSISSAAGNIELYFESDEYIPKYIDDYNVEDYQTIWLNISMTPRPPENSIACGYITDLNSKDPIENARVILEWKDDQENTLEYETYTNSLGYYNIEIPAGETYLYLYAKNYISKSTYRNDAKENNILWINTSLEPDIIQVDILKPLKAIYINGNRLIPNPRCIIFGNIAVEAFIHDLWYRSRNDVEKVEFYIDNDLKETIISEPFIWSWTDKTFGKRTIEVVAYDNEVNIVSKELEVLKLF